MNLRTRSGQLDPGNLTCGQSVPPPYGSDKHGVDDSLSSGTRDSSQASVFHSSNSRSFPLESDKPRSSTASIEGHDTRKLHDSSSFDKIIHGMMNEKSDPSRTAHRISIKRTQTLADGVSKCVDPLTVDISASLPRVARFHANKVLKFRDALLTSYHRNEVKYVELTLDAFRMMQCLEWEPCRSFYQKIPAQPLQHDTLADQSGTSGLIDINLLADMTDPTLPPNPRKTVFYRLTVTQLIVVLATVVDELPPDSVMLIYLSDSGMYRSSIDAIDGLTVPLCPQCMCFLGEKIKVVLVILP
ncbi:hypothetical protein AG4045_018173 [Apium graveolens]|uniref:Uncharacterized protein n=1 Tax=Apium graveolens TaxID=4045 RepID=A0A6L5B9R3_APIGR|nr:hypothetical protein AG4045_018173 [Apium graveolens]